VNKLTMSVVVVVLLTLAICPATAVAGGVGGGVSVYTIDVATTLGKVPLALEAAFGKIEDGLADYGVPQQDLDEISAAFDDLVNDIELAAADFPLLLPVPLIGGSIEFSVPFLVIDAVRFSGGGLSDRFVWGMLDAFGLERPQWPIEESFQEGELEVEVTIDPSFSSFMLSTELVKRLDLLVAGIEFGLGFDLAQGKIDPGVTITASHLQSELDDALAALHPDELSWSAFCGHACVGVEVGPPFLRLYGRARFLLPLSQSTTWWGIKVGALTGSVGLVIRF